MVKVPVAASVARQRGRPPKADGPGTRDRLLDAALKLFARQGYAGTSIREIAGVVGVRDSAIYGHFPSKQAIYEALFAEAGSVSLDVLDLDIDTVTAGEPDRMVPELVARLMRAWSAPRARLFTGVLMREGAPTPGGRYGSGIAAAVEAARSRLEPPFRRWTADGKLRADLAPEQLVWELFTPLAALRFLHLHAEATDADLQTAAELADRHVTFFLACTRP